ncbi:MAG: hypothetical protein O2960_18770 [Verrucomicrobia bacterium]|nr:hypothetical protein [Verrucomicrobiota bacterium]
MNAKQLVDTNVRVRFFSGEPPAMVENHPIASFDRDFDKFKDVQRIEPKT